MNYIDLRSDTVTRPTPTMLEVMMHAAVGDDVFEEDPSVKLLEQTLAAIFGMEAGLFCPSGTMANQIAIRVHTQPQDQVICDKRSHIYLYEGGGLAYNSMISAKLLDGERGMITAEMIAAHINPDDVHFPKTSLVSLENTMNKGGGACYPITQLEAIADLCKENQLKLHLDGARIFNALVATQQPSQAYGQLFDSISVCLSKGLGAPVGSVLLSTKAHIQQAKRVRKVFGGGMRQAGYLAAAGLYAIEHHVDRLADDHQRATALKELLLPLNFVEEVLPVETNIVIFTLPASLTAAAFLPKLEEKGLKAVPFGKHQIRFVTHLDFDDQQLEAVERILKSVQL
ncbi:MAG: threonine aldolase family protein [Flammeovirgaceae bacterium]